METLGKSALNPTQGHLLAGVEVDEHRFLARVPPDQLFLIAPDPRSTEDKKKLAGSPELQELRHVRNQIQRLFEGAKERNVPSYADYIINLSSGSDGMTPPIILYSPKALPTAVDDAGIGYAQVPWGTVLAALDGETQLASRFESAAKDPNTKMGFVAVYIVHGKPAAFARQCFHDLNVLGVRPNAALAISMDARDPVTAVTRAVAVQVPFFSGRVNEKSRQLKRSDPQVMTLSALRGACVTFMLGIGGVKFGTKPVTDISMEQAKKAEPIAVDWFKSLTNTIGPAMEAGVRQTTVASSPAVWAALGALGHDLLAANETERPTVKSRLLEGLKEVTWNRDHSWDGIAGKMTTSGKLTLGGSKEVAYAVYNALRYENQTGYRSIRGGATVTA
jgi:DNA sulfur modification protein DndB